MTEIRTPPAFTAAVLISLAGVAAATPALAASGQTTTSQTTTTTTGAASSPAGDAEATTARIAIRSGDHPGFGRIVLDTNGKPRYRIRQDGDRVVLRLAGDAALGAAPSLPRNVTAIKTDGGKLELVLSRGARLHPVQAGGHIVLDILDAPPAAASQPEPAAASRRHAADELPAAGHAAAPAGAGEGAQHEHVPDGPGAEKQAADRPAGEPATASDQPPASDRPNAADHPAAPTRSAATASDRHVDPFSRLGLSRRQEKALDRRLHTASRMAPSLMASSPELAGRDTVVASAPAASTPSEPPAAAADGRSAALPQGTGQLAIAAPLASRPTPSAASASAAAPATAERVAVAAQPLDAPSPQAAASQASTSQPAISQPATSPPSAPPVPAAQTAATAALETTQQTPPGRDVLPENDSPLGLRARRMKLPKGADGSAILLPFDSTTGAAAFASGDGDTVVFDERRPVDMAGLAADPVFSHASIRLLANGTAVHLPHPPSVSIALTPMPLGWRIAAVSATPKHQPIASSLADGHLALAADQPGDVVSMADPDTGATLLVGTQHRPGQAVAASRRSTEFVLRPTSQGVVVEPLSDAVAMKQVPTGFSLSGNPGGLALSPVTSMTPALMEAAHLTRRLNLSSMPTDALLRLSIRQIGDAARTPSLARAGRHRAAAESMVALGLGAEAESLLQMTAEQDPKAAASPDNAALAAIAALLAGRPEESGALLDPRLDGTDEIALWRGVRQAMQEEGSPAAASVFAATAPLVFQYPAPVRDHILPLMIETMIQGGQPAAAARLLDQRKGDPKLAYARAMLRQANGDSTQALSMLDTIAGGHDQFDRARAAVRAVELRLAAGQLTKVQAADALDKLLYAWRGDTRELALRERVAELREQSDNWRVALSVLRQAETDFPQQAGLVRERMKDVFARMVHDKAAQQIPPLEFVATVDENTDLLPDAGNDELVEQPLSERLLALDLPGRAKPVLDKLMHQAKAPTAKARFATSLATLAAHEGDAAAVLGLLKLSDAPDLPAPLTEQRLILQAEAMARQGEAAAAATLLAAAPTGPTLEARARILEAAADWAGAQRAWAEFAARAVPAAGPLDDHQAHVVLRLATSTARAGDEQGLTRLRSAYNDRLQAGPLADMFRLLTAEPVRSLADIKRSQQEVSLAASIPADLKAIQGTPTH